MPDRQHFDCVYKLLSRLKNTSCFSSLMELTLNELNAIVEMEVGELEKGERLTMSEFGDRLGLCRSAISQLVTRLEKKGMVKRETAIDDRRKTHVFLTEDGKMLINEQNFKRIEMAKKIQEKLGSEFELFIRLLEKCIKALEEGDYA